MARPQQPPPQPSPEQPPDQPPVVAEGEEAGVPDLEPTQAEFIPIVEAERFCHNCNDFLAYDHLNKHPICPIQHPQCPRNYQE
jgi:hypothetical protein